MAQRKIPSAVRLPFRTPSNQKKPKVVIFYDRDGWAFHNISNECLKHLKDEFEISAKPFWPKEPDFQDVDVAILMWYGYSHLFDKTSSTCRKITCVYDESLWPIKPNFRKQFEEAARKSHLLMGSSPNIERQLRQTCSHPVLPCYDGVSPQKFPFQSARRELLAGHPLRVGWAGNSDPGAHGDNKGLHLIKQAAAEMTGVEFVIQDRRGKKVWIPHDQMHEWYRDLDIVLCMSRQEGTPNPILEASSCGRAWISTDVGVVRAMSMSAPPGTRPGMIISRQVNALKHAINYLDQHRDEVVQMGLNGRKAIESEWTWEKKVNQFRHAIREVLK